MDDARSTTESDGAESTAPISNPNSLGARNVAHVAHGYGNLDALERTPPMVVTRGQGVSIVDEEGRDYIEGVAGMWCANFGFSESELVDAAIEQFRALPYYHSLIDKTTEPMGRLAERLKASTHVPMARVFFANSGSEANDTLVKLAWYYHNAIGKPEKKKIVSRFMGFHGVTCGAASVTGIPQMHTDFDLPVNDLFLKTDCPHYYRYGEPGESEEDYASRLAANLEELIVKEGPETVAAFFRRARDGRRWLHRAAQDLFREGAGGARQVRSAVLRRRGHHRLRADRQLAGVGDLQHPPRRTLARQGAGQRLPADLGGDDQPEALRRHAGREPQAGLLRPCLHHHRAPGGGRRGAAVPGADGGARRARQRAPRGAPCCRSASGVSPTTRWWARRGESA